MSRPPALQLAICALIAASEGFDLAAMGLAGPAMIRALGLGPGAFGLAATATMAGFFLGSLIGGRLGDRSGRRDVLLVSLGIVAVGSFATVGASGFSTLVAARLVTGIGIGGVYPNLIALAAQIASTAHRARTVTLVNCGGSVGSLGGALLLGVGGAALDWRVFFELGAVVALALIPLGWRLLPSGHEKVPASAASVYGALFNEGRWRMTLLLWLANFVTAFAFYAVANWVPTLLAARGLVPREIGMANGMISICAMIGALLLATYFDWRRGWTPFAAAYVGMAMAFTLLAAADSVSGAIFAAAMIGLFVMGGQLLLYTLAPELYPRSALSTGVGWSVAAGRLGAVLSPLTIGLALQGGTDQRTVLLLMAPALLLAGTAAVFTASAVPAARGQS